MEKDILKQFESVPVNYDTILSVFKDYKSPKDKISYMERQGDLIRLKKGLYIVSPALTKRPFSKELLANHIYGPSYVSLETALFYYGLIPEAVYSAKSMTLKRSKSFSTAYGQFEYIKVPEKYFQIGIRQIEESDNTAYLIASPEKAVCDMLISSRNLRLQSVKAMKRYLIEDLRIDMSAVDNWDADLVREIVKTGHKKTELTQFIKAIENER
ncbi:MAG: hypothetical protein FWD54_03000 [Endomicrobia bacterium]|nr:hypothetical protein [Endomicrobiia bacterium]MCL2799232.1 hypothetical protein [Endomicrobiia bacterium]